MYEMLRAARSASATPAETAFDRDAQLTSKRGTKGKYL